MKRLIGIALAGAAVSLVGCKQNPQQAEQNLQETRAEATQDIRDAEKQAQENIAEEQHATAENLQEERREVAETRQEAQQEIAEAEQDVAEARRDQFENRDEQGVGGTGEQYRAQSQTWTGTVTDTGSDDFKLRDQAGKEIELKFADNAAITLDGKEVDRKALYEGAEVRAHADLRDGEWYVKSVEVVSSPDTKQYDNEPKK